MVAHDHKKDELLSWVKKHREILSQHQLIATGTTGKLISDFLGVNVKRVMSGPLGGDPEQISETQPTDVSTILNWLDG